MNEVIKYVCNHCKREYRVKANAEKHESICWKNPSLKTCITCIHFDGFDYDPDGSRYIVCKKYPDLPEGDKPEVNCEYWEHDQRTKKEKEQERLNKLVKQLNETGLTF